MSTARGRLAALRIPLLVLLLGAPAPLLAQADGGPRPTPERPTTSIARVSAAPVIDGVLDDAAWSSLPVLSPFVQRIPRDGEAPSQATEVRIGYDKSAIYVGIRALDADPAQIVPGEGIRDTDLSQSDALVLIFDTYKDGVNGFVFGTNPAGVEYDGQVVDQGGGTGNLRGGSLAGGGRQQGGSGDGFNLNWDGSWDVATSRDAQGWSAEFRIPFSTLRYRAAARQDWGFNVLRRIRRMNEESFWSPISRQFDLYRVSEAGSLNGLEPPAGRSVRVTPYLLGSTARNYAIGQRQFDQSGDFGADAKVLLTQGLTLDLTYNTDFAQVEVDDAQTNLTRFSIQFPEKRPFFLENAGLFSVGGGGADLFFSRRIGIARDGTRVPIQGGGRLSGKLAGLNVGVLHIRTDSLDGVQSGQAYSVARVYKDLGNRTNLGASFLQRDGLGTEGDYNRTYGVDGQLGVGEALNLKASWAGTETPGRTGDDRLLNTQADYNSRSVTLNAQYSQVGKDFNPEVGYLQRSDYRFYKVRWMSYVRPKRFLGMREIRPHSHYQTNRNLRTGFEESTQWHLDTHFEWNSGMFFSPATNWTREGLVKPFEISKGIVIPPGTYDGWIANWQFYTNQSAPVHFETTWDYGSFFSGHRAGNAVVVGFRQGSALSTALRLEYNRVDLAEGSFRTHLGGLRVGYFFSPQIYLQSLVQYSDQTDNWSANVRFGWLSTAGTGLFVVYNQASGVDSLSGPLNRSLIIKYSRLLNVLGG